MRGQSVKAFVVLKKEILPTEETKEKILEHCRRYVAKYALPRFVEFRDEMPKTSVGKVAYRILEEEEKRKER
jgi:long-chain acyl-CoA synthetase